MNRLRFAFLITFSVLAVFAQAAWDSPRLWLGAQFNWLPSLVICGAAAGHWGATFSLATVGGFCLDSLSQNPLGISVLSLLALGWVMHRSRDVVLMDDSLVQAMVGASGSAAVFGLDLLILWTMGATPLVGWMSGWQATVVAAGGAVMTPVWFLVLPRLEKAFGYAAVSPPSFRPDREIKRGRF
jgi:cell shape-determining protein MreD